ncbi:alpha/beta hydrolase [Actinospica sp.]|uniref:alpha/beta fold hydrolase n=1 Tax=Actinospica sp. TaxID=1872142 RepID=UPI002CC9DA42|nr:alpha/beta hydrolase [Actinospica sp.]HWG25142.1 alpha/beta hydrolase [Actinospica sp.]
MDQYTPPVPDARLRIPSADGTQLNVEVHGPTSAQTTVVLVHGWTCKIAFWAPVIGALRAEAPELRVVAYDQRGHGESEIPGNDAYSVPILVEDLRAVLDATLRDDERAVLVGHSMGGMTIMAAAGDASILARIGGAVLCSTGFANLPGSSTVVPGLKRLPKANRAAHRFLLTSTLPVGPVTPISRAMLKHTALGPKSNKHLQKVNARIITACRPKPRAGWGRVLTELDVTEQVGKLDVPTSAVFGTSDRLTPPAAHAQAIADALPRFEGLTTLTGLGHMTPLEAPDVVSMLIRQRVRAMLNAADVAEAAKGSDHE